MWDQRSRVQISFFTLRTWRTSFYGLGVKTLSFQLKDRSSILLRSKVEGLFYLFALSIVISGVMVISALNPVHSVL